MYWHHPPVSDAVAYPNGTPIMRNDEMTKCDDGEEEEEERRHFAFSNVHLIAYPNKTVGNARRGAAQRRHINANYK